MTTVSRLPRELAPTSTYPDPMLLYILGTTTLFVARRDQEKVRVDRNIVLLDRWIEDAVVVTADCSDRPAMHNVQHLEARPTASVLRSRFNSPVLCVCVDYGIPNENVLRIERELRSCSL